MAKSTPKGNPGRAEVNPAAPPSWIEVLKAAACDPELTHGAARLFSVLVLKYWNRKTGVAFPEQRTLAKDMGSGTNPIAGWVAELEDRAYITVSVVGKNHQHVYRFPFASSKPISPSSPSRHRFPPFASSVSSLRVIETDDVTGTINRHQEPEGGAELGSGEQNKDGRNPKSSSPKSWQIRRDIEALEVDRQMIRQQHSVIMKRVSRTRSPDIPDDPGRVITTRERTDQLTEEGARLMRKVEAREQRLKDLLAESAE